MKTLWLVNTIEYSFQSKRSKLKRRLWPKMSSKAEVVRRIEMIDQLSTILKDLRRSEMEELERIEDEEESRGRAKNKPEVSGIVRLRLSVQEGLKECPRAWPVFAREGMRGCPQSRTAPLIPWPRGTCCEYGDAVLPMWEKHGFKNGAYYTEASKNLRINFDRLFAGIAAASPQSLQRPG